MALNEKALTSLFRRILAVAASSPIALSAACGGKTGDVVIPPAADASDDGEVPATPDAGSCAPVSTGGVGCGTVLTYPCGIPGVNGVPGMTLPSAQCQSLCTNMSTFCSITSVDHATGATTLQCGGCVTGRRPAGLEAANRRGVASPLGDYFAECARLEAASVTAFDILARELASLGAPRALVRRAERAARDEVRHAAVVGALAARWGATVEAPSVAEASRERTLEEIATENAVEGCVRETFGALVATLQARAAGERVVAGVLRRIARDETRHAALAWSVAAWADAGLDQAARARVEHARRTAVAELRLEIERDPHEALATAAGLPGARKARAMVDGMDAALWS